MQEIPHAPGYTLAADAFMAPTELVGFNLEHHYRTVFSHFHEFYELTLVLRGTGIHETAHGAQRVGRGSAVFIAPGASHGWAMCDDMLVYNCHIRAEAARFELWWAQRDEVLGSLLAPSGRPPAAPIVVELDEQALATCQGELDAIRLRPSTQRGSAFDLGHLLLVLDVVARSARTDTGVTALKAQAPSVVRSALEMLEADLRRHWRLDELATELSLGTFHLARLFRRWVGIPPIAYANRRRAELATALLSGTDMTVAEVGAEVGWPDPSTFARRFRHEYAVSPRTYRLRSRSPGLRGT